MVLPIHGLKTVADWAAEYPDIRTIPPDLQTWRQFSPEVFTMLERERPRVVLEIGSWKGYSTSRLALYADVVYAVDTWLGALEFYTQPGPDRDLMKRGGYPSVYYQFAANMHHMGVAHKVIPVPLPSSIAVPLLGDLRPDVVYVDGSHEYEDVARDLRSVARLKPRVIFGDDYGVHYPGVVQAVDTFCMHNSDVTSMFHANEYYFITL